MTMRVKGLMPANRVIVPAIASATSSPTRTRTPRLICPVDRACRAQLPDDLGCEGAGAFPEKRMALRATPLARQQPSLCCRLLIARKPGARAELALHLLQAALVYVNTLMIQDILAEPEWAGVLTAEDLRGLTPLFWAHVRPYGEVRLNMTRRLALSASDTPDVDRESA